MIDLIIIGAGPAGISASLYAKRANNNVLILYNGESNLEKAEKIDNYYGFENGISGQELQALWERARERKMKMELKDTIELMTSADWKDRFKAEY